MRDIPPSLQTHLENSVTTLCTAWQLELGDGRVFGFSEHDRDFEIEGVLFKAKSSLNTSESESRLGFSADNGNVQGVIESLSLTPDEIEAGALDDAVLSRLKVNWAEPSQHVILSVGTLGQVTTQGDYYAVEWLGFSSKLDRSTGRVFSKKCDADFCDTRCGLNAENFAEDVFCSKTFLACRDQFQNAENFRGFPYLLGDDALLSAPQQGERKDGTSRFR